MAPLGTESVDAIMERERFPGFRGVIVIAVMAVAPIVFAQTARTTAMKPSSIAQAQAELEQLAARLPMTLDMGPAMTRLTIDPYAEEDPAQVWNDWRMENKKDREPPQLVIVAHNLWAELHGQNDDADKRLSSRWVVPVKEEMTSERVITSLNIAPSAPILGEEAETFISVDPNNPQHIVASANHRLLGDATCTSALSTSGVTLNSNGGQMLYWSTDGGASWSHLCAPWHSGTAYTLTSVNGTSPFTFQSSDPSIAWDSSGNAYVFTLPWWQDAGGSFSGNAVNVVKWTAATNTWAAITTPQSYINCTSSSCDTMDKTEGAIDATSGQAFSHPNRMYFAWTRIFLNVTFRYRMRIAFADPPYTSWTINDFAPGGTVETGNSVTRLSSSMTVGADGTVYLAWERSLTTGSTQLISKSTDGGLTWTTGVTMSSTATLTDFATNTKIAAQDTRGIAILPQLAIDAAAASPFKGRLYESYTDFHTGVTSGNDVDVYVLRSTDGGATWATVATFTGVASGTSQFEPITTVDPSTGVVTVAWYDTSVDPALNRKVQIYASQSTDGGTTWSAQALVTDSGAAFSHHLNYLDENSTDMPNVTTLHHYQYGEYMGASSSGGNLWLAWTDSRNWLAETPSDTTYEDIGVNLPCTPPAAVVLTSVTVPQNNRIDVAWNDSSSASATQYLVSRSTVPGGPYTVIATVPDSSPGLGSGAPYVDHDDTVSGGVTYYYVVIASNGLCSSSRSNEMSAVATGLCLLPPTFGGLVAVTNPGSSTCTLSLAWNAGTSNCSSSVTYNVYRSTSSGFVPAPASRITTGVSGTSYMDATGISSGTTYYYVVRAVDTLNSVEETNTTQKSGTPTGPITTSSFTDMFEGGQSGGGFDLAGWTRGTISGATNWAWSTAQSHDPTHSWFAADVAGPDDKVLVSPSFGVIAGTTLSFWHTFAFEGTVAECYDAGTLEITTNGGSTWTVVPAADFTAGAYTGTANTGFSNPIGGLAAWCAGTVGPMTQVSLSLGGDAGLLNNMVQIRWHEGDDDSVSATGWYVDTVAVNDAGVAGTCTTGSCTAPGAPTLTSATGDCRGVTLAWTAGTGSTSSYNVYRSTTPGGPYTKLGGMPVATTTYLDTTGTAGTPYDYVVTGACDAAGTIESAHSNELLAAKSGSGAACSDGNACTTNDACSGGACFGGPALVCDDGNVCNGIETCNPASGCQPGTPPVCSDGNFCNGIETCDPASGCQPGMPLTCNDGNPCTDDSCNPATGCATSNNTNPCNDGNACTSGDTCGGGSCNPGTPVVCNDNNVCTTDTCKPATGCAFTNNANPCDDGNACTVGDTCGGGVCGSGSGGPVESIVNGGFQSGGGATSCGPNAFQRSSWIGTGSALQHSGCGWTGPDLTVSLGSPDGVTPGTISQSFAATTGPGTLTYKHGSYDAGPCSYTVRFGPSNTVIPVSSAALIGGLAAAAPISVPMGTTSLTFGDVDCSQSGLALVQLDNVSLLAGGSVLECDDHNLCTDDTCDPASGCIHANNTSGCNDGNVCTTGDTCGGGTCNPGTPIVCADNNVCTTDTCDPVGGCVHTNNTNPCSDGSACTAGDTCGGGTCHPGAPVSCNDNNPCTDDTCQPESGCVYANNTNGCDDGNPCTIGDVCGSGACTGTGITAPPETHGVQASPNKATYTWSAATYATRYDVVRGSVGAFPVGPGGGDESCFDNLTGTSLTDSTVPTAGSGFWYLSRGENACGIGTFGTRSNGAARSTTTCP